MENYSAHAGLNVGQCPSKGAALDSQMPTTMRTIVFADGNDAPAVPRQPLAS